MEESSKFLQLNLSTAGVAAMLVGTFTHPLDLLKTRMQIVADRHLGMGALARSIWREEGPLAFQKGVQACWLRESLQSSMRLGLYEPFKILLVGQKKKEQIPFLLKLASGSMSGLVGSFFGNPADVLRTRMMAAQDRSTGLGEMAREVQRQQGLPGFFRGISATLLRASVNNGVKMAVQDELKQALRQTLGSGVGVQALSGSLAAGCQAVVVAPLDMARTRLMNQPKHHIIYKGLFDCLKQVVQNEGFTSLYKGLIPMQLRGAPNSVLQLIVWEKLRLFVGLKNI